MVGKTILDKKIVQFQKPTYSFGVISDVHINRTNQDAEGDLRKAFSAFRNRGITRVFCCGDISTNHTEDELQTFAAVKNEFPEMTFKSCTGNHDAEFTDLQWQQYIGHDFSNGEQIRAHVTRINGDAFIFLPIANWENARPYSYGNDSWADGFAKLFQREAGRRVFVFMHFPLNSESASFQYPGLKIGQYYGFGSGSMDNTTIIQKIEDACSDGGVKNVTVFSGHSHYAFDVQNVTSDFKDSIFLQEGGFSHVHVPSLVVPRDKDMNVIQSGHPELQPVQGYVVDVYQDHVKLTGLEFSLRSFDADQRKGLVRIDNRYAIPFEGKNLKEPLRFTAQDAGASVTLAKINTPNEAQIVYSTDGTTWSDYSFGTAIMLANVKDFVMFRAKDGVTNGMSSGSGYYQFQLNNSKRVAASGNIQSLMRASCDLFDIAANNYCYQRMFQSCTSLTQAPELPATTLANWCYYWMFNGCKSLVQAPELPATTLANYCYQDMFNGCKSLVQAPELPATTLAEECYSSMFNGCKSLAKAPELLATTLAKGCCQFMFAGCTSLSRAPALPAMTLANSCYVGMFTNCTSLTQAPELPTETLAVGCYGNMFTNCTSLTQAPELPATTLANNCYYQMFNGCTSLTQAPTLPATTLAEECYCRMFNGCTSLTSIDVSFTAWNPANATTNWMTNAGSQAAGTKTFTCPATLPQTIDSSHIPSGWTIVTK